MPDGTETGPESEGEMRLPEAAKLDIEQGFGDGFTDVGANGLTNDDSVSMEASVLADEAKRSDLGFYEQP